MISNYNGFMSAATAAQPNRSEDNLTEIFYLLEIFTSQYTPEDGDYTEYLEMRLQPYQTSLGLMDPEQ